MQRIYINRTPVIGPWGGGNKALTAFYEQQGEKFEICDKSPDAAIVFGLDADGSHVSAEVLATHCARSRCKLVLRVNDCDARKATNNVDTRWLELSRHAHKTIFVSEWMREYYTSRGWGCDDCAVIINGIDRDTFKPLPRPPLGRMRIVTAHWSDNPLKGADVSEWIDKFVGRNKDRFEYTYVGRTRSRFVHARLVPALDQQELACELAQHDICINASRFDPGPNSVLESIACGLPTYVHADGGGCCEFAGKDHVFANTDELEQLLLVGDVRENTQNVVPTDWCTYVDECVKFIQE